MFSNQAPPLSWWCHIMGGVLYWYIAVYWPNILLLQQDVCVCVYAHTCRRACGPPGRRLRLLHIRLVPQVRICAHTLFGILLCVGTCSGHSSLPSSFRQPHWTGLKLGCRCAVKVITCWISWFIVRIWTTCILTTISTWNLLRHWQPRKGRNLVLEMVHTV
jgi:hypothetical protein